MLFLKKSPSSDLSASLLFYLSVGKGCRKLYYQNRDTREETCGTHDNMSLERKKLPNHPTLVYGHHLENPKKQHLHISATEKKKKTIRRVDEQ